MMSIPQLTAAVKAAPMPLRLKEQILDAALGHHDDLHMPARPVHAPRPKAERVAEARRVGAFDFLRTLPSGDAVYAYCKMAGDCKAGEPAYEVTVRDGQPVGCTCPDFRFRAAHDPAHDCKHHLLFIQQEAADALIAEAARLAGEWQTAWAYHKLGRITDAEEMAAYARYEAARATMRKVVLP